MTRRTMPFLPILVALTLGPAAVNAAPLANARAASSGTSTSSPVAPDHHPPSLPSDLTMTLAGTNKQIPAGGWVAGTRLDLRFRVRVTHGPLIPQVEIQPFDTPFTGQSNFNGPAMTASGLADVPVSGLSNGKTYHWQARVVDSSSASSPWTPFASADATTPDLGVDLSPPSRPTISSPSDPDPNRWYNTRSVVLRWSSSDSLSGIQGFTYVLERRAQVIPPGPIVVRSTVTLSQMADGVWFVAVRSVDRAGNWSPTATFRLQLDRQVPQLTWLSPARFTFNPYAGPSSMRVRVSKEVSLRLDLYRVGDRRPTRTYSYPHLAAGQTVTITWTGKDARGNPVPKGYYFFSAVAVDHASNTGRVNLGGIVLDPQRGVRIPTGQTLYPGDGKRIIVSLSRQTLYAYDGDRLLLQTLVTTGNPSLPTPAGSYTILGKYHPFEFISPWPQGSPYWYPPSWSTYAMLFRDGGYFLHDAPWRSTFGPGTNGPGQPGTNYGGTHGCVNIPPAPMIFLWNWAPVGTRVDVVP